MLSVTILGNNSAIPAFDRHPTAQVVHSNDQNFLIDCGEGTQMQMDLYKIRRSRINHIFISHLHGDHYFGLIGLLTSMGLLGRKTDLHLYGPALLQKIIEMQLEAAGAHLPYSLHFRPLKKEESIVEIKSISIECFQVYHRIECWGFLFREKRNIRKIDPMQVKKYNIPTLFYENLQHGEDYITENNNVIRNELLTSAGTPPKAYAYCADTIFNEQLAEKVKSVDLLYHESTYLHIFQEKAALRYHSTSVEAAKIARKAGVKKLLLGHFSSKYESLDDFKNEACTIFENTELAVEGCTFIV